jgi:F-type H+-transporting ATPase subunit gamma
MANLKEVKERIGSVSSTIQITSAMKMVSASKLRKAQDAIMQMRPYAEKLQEIISNVSSSLDSSEGIYSREREVKNVLIFAISSNRGLCGPFNANIAKKAKTIIAANKGNNITVLAAGKKVEEAFKGTEYAIKGVGLPKHLNELYSDLTYENVSKAAEKVMNAFVTNQFDQVILVYNKFKNAAVQEIMAEQFLPAVPPKNETTDNFSSDYIFEPNKDEIIEELIPKSLRTQFYKAFLDSYAAEHGARMTAMHKATDNATDMLKELKLTYNKARQAAITNEILEIVGGAEALKGK